MPNPYDKYGQPSNFEDLFPSQPQAPRPRRAIGPLRVRPPLPEEPAEPVKPEPEEELGWFQRYAPHVARGIGGLFGVNPATGALGGAAGEVVAQAIEQGDWTPDLIGEDNKIAKRIAAESAIGAAGGGFAKLLGSGITSVGRALGAGAALGGGAPIIRHGFEEGEWDPREYAGEVGTGAAIGGAVGGGLAKLFGMIKGKPAGPASRYEVETTAVPGGQVLGASGHPPQFVNPVRPIHGGGDPIGTQPTPPPSGSAPAGDVHRVPYMGGDVALLPSQQRLIDREARAAERAAKVAEKQALEEEKLTELRKLLEGRGKTEARLGESVSAVDPTTGHRLSASFREVAEEGGEGGGGVLARQADEPTGPAGGDLQEEMERIRQEIARVQAAEAPMARLNALRDKAQAGTLTGEELDEARALDAALRERGFPPDVEPPLAGSPVAVGPGPQGPPSAGGVEAPLPVQPEVPAPSPLEAVLSGKQPGKTRAKRAGKSKSERFDERAAAIAASAGDVRPPEGIQWTPETWAAHVDQMGPNPGYGITAMEDALDRPMDIGDRAAANAAIDAAEDAIDNIPVATPEAGPTSQDLSELILGQHTVQPGLTRALSNLDIRSAEPKWQMDLLRQQLQGGAKRTREARVSPIPEAPLATPEAPPDLIQILRTRVGATGKNYRLARDAAKSGEIPSAGFAREAHLREQAALRGQTPEAPAPVPPAPTSWMDDEAATIARLSALPKEQRLAAFLGDEAPTIPPVETPVAPEVPLATTDVEPEWVAKAMAEADELAKMQTAQPPAPPPVSDLEKLLAGTGGELPPTAEQITELQRLRQESGAISDPSQVPSWLQGVIAAAPEAPSSVKPPASPGALVKPGQEGAPRLQKGGKYGGHEGPPNPQDYRPTFNKERGAAPTALMAQLGMGLAGAAVGGAVDPLGDPLLSAMAGGAVGLSIPTMAQGLLKLGAAPDVVQNAMQDLNLPDGAKRAAAKVARVLPQMQRANYLADILGLGANAWFGPYGSGVFGALEKGLAGDPRGWAALNELKNPWSFFKEYPSAFQEARSLVGRAEGFSEAEAIGALEKKLTLPGTMLTGGDVAIRRILERHGFSEEEARIMTMTGEPFTKSGESLAHMRGLIPDLTFPFKRTPVNIVEQGLLRTPGVGFLQQGIGAARGTRQADPLSLQLAQQGMGLGVAAGTEQLGEHLDPEQARVLRRFVTNFAGPYSLLAGAGMAAGQAKRRGQPIVGTTVRNISQQLPLPSIEPIQEVAALGAKVMDRGPSAIRGRDIPRGAYPAGLVRNYEAVANFLNPPKLPSRRRRRRE